MSENEDSSGRLGAKQEELKMTREAFYKVIRLGTIEHSFTKIAKEITSSYVIQTRNDYVYLFFYDKQTKSLSFEAGLIRESDEKELRKFI